MSKPFLIKKIADDIPDDAVDKVWWREADAGKLIMNRKVAELNEYISGNYEISYFTYCNRDKRQHEYYLTIEKGE